MLKNTQIAIGLGGSSSCRASEAITEVAWDSYARSIESGVVPLGSATGFDENGCEARAIKMALSSCRPLSERLHQKRFPGRSLFAPPWHARFESLRDRGLVMIDHKAGEIALTEIGTTLVEAVINTEL